jgi:hypothetical protein
MPWSNSVAWMRTSQPVRSSTSVLRTRVRVRHSRTCAGEIQASGSRPSASGVRTPARVLAVGLGAPLAAAARPRLGRLGQVRDGPSLTQRLTHEQPTRAGLDRDDDPPAPEAPNPTAHRLPVRRNTPTVDLARFRIERVEGDLTSVHVKPIGASSKSSDICHFARVSRAERGRPPFMPSPRRRQRKPVGPLRLCGGESELEPIVCRRASLAVGLVRTRGSRCRSLRSSGRGEARAGGADTDATAALLAAIALALAAGNPARCPRWV